MLPTSDFLSHITYLTGSDEIAANLHKVPAHVPFDERIIEFLNDFSREIMRDPRGKEYSDVVTFGFWIRRGSILKLKEKYYSDGVYLGRGVAFHIAPSNVPVNFAYSMVAGLLCGNANIVRVPSKDFPQVSIITEALNKVLEKYDDVKPYVLCIRYGHDVEVNDFFSSIADVRLVWGGDKTIAQFRESKLSPRSGEITFADRYSLAVIDSDTYIEIEDKKKVAEDFYNDTFLNDQNACTSPRFIIWTGHHIKEAKNKFWELEYDLVKRKYDFQPIQAVNKMVDRMLIAVTVTGVRVEEHKDNFIIRVNIPGITEDLQKYCCNSGYFYEYDCEDILELVPLCNDKKCQTLAYIGDKNKLFPLIEYGVKGIDRIVPIGKTLDFDLIWDGYNLFSELTRAITFG